MLKKTLLVGFAALVGGFVVGGSPLWAQDSEAIAAAQQERIERFKASGASVKAMYQEYLPAQDYQAIKAEAAVLVRWAGDIPAAFPFGSDSDDDEARPEIWSDFEGFKQAAKSFETAALALQSATDQNDIDMVKKALDNVGASCKACHRKYRKK